jgi:hypothetical protein
MRKTSPGTSERGPLAAALFALVLACGPGCSSANCDTSDDGNPPTPYVGGTVADGVYESSGWHGPLLWLPGGKRYDVVHGLGFEPREVLLYLSFSSTGSGQAATGDTMTLASGNAGVLQMVNDRVIRVKNDTCAEFWLRVVASGDPRRATPVDDAGTADALPPADAAATDAAGD